MIAGGLAHPYQRRYAVAAAVVLLAAAVSLLIVQHSVRVAEAWLDSGLLAHVGVVKAVPVGVTIVFPHSHQFVALDLTAECSAALLMVPFVLIGAALLLTRRVSVQRGVLAVVGACVVVFVVNEARIMAIALSIRIWGIKTGYERGHLLLGSVMSTLGLIVGVVLFLLALLHEQRQEGSRRGLA